MNIFALYPRAIFSKINKCKIKLAINRVKIKAKKKKLKQETRQFIQINLLFKETLLFKLCLNSS